MENASKALIMAGGMLIAILLLSLLIYAWNMFSKYQTSQNKLSNIENTAKFNEQFAQFDRKDLKGYEVLSLINKTIDYNERKTTDSIYQSDSYPYIDLTISMKTKDGHDDYINAITFDGQVRLFSKDKYTTQNELSAKNRNAPGSFKNDIEEKIRTAIEEFKINGGNEDSANKIAKNIKSIFMTADEINARATRLYNGNTNVVKNEMVQKYYECTGETVNANTLILGNNPNTNRYYVYACQLYEYMQFKRSVFECETFEYDETTGRVNKIMVYFVKVQ